MKQAGIMNVNNLIDTSYGYFLDITNGHVYTYDTDFLKDLTSGEIHRILTNSGQIMNLKTGKVDLFNDNNNLLWSSYGAPRNLTLILISGGVKLDWDNSKGGNADTEIWGKSDSGTYSLLYTITAGTLTKNDICNPVDLRYYKIRSKNGSLYSDFTAEESIAMLGPEKITAGDMSDATKWGMLATLWHISGGIASCNADESGHFLQPAARMVSNIVINERYKVSFDVGISGGNAYLAIVEESLGSLILFTLYGNGNHIGYFNVTVANYGYGGFGFYLDFTQTDNPFTIDNVSLKKVLFP